MKTNQYTLAGCALPLFFITGAAAADTPVLPSVTVVADKSSVLDSKTSTGSGLDLTLMQTPASVELISREQLEQRGDSKLVDAITRAAGISSMAHPGNGGSSLSARGFTDTTSVMRLYDGVRQYGGVGLTFPFDTWSVERIEVLRGPASVIYGDGAIGGVVNVIPKKPTRGAIRNEVQATVGTDNTQRLGLGSGGAIDEHWSYRLDASGERSNGWVDMGQSRELAFSGALEWDATPDLRFTLRHAQGLQHPMRYFGTPTVNGRQLPALRDKNYNVGDSIIRYDDRWSELGMEWTPSSATTVRAKLYHIDSQRHYRNAETYAYNAGTGLVDRSGDTEILHDQRQTGATATVSHAGTLLGLGNQASIGVDLSSSRFQHTNNTYAGSPDPASVDPFFPVAGNFFSEQPTLPRYRNAARQYAIFAENRIELTPAWAVIAGLRHDHADVRRRNLVTGQEEFDQSYDNTGWRLGTVFDVTHRPGPVCAICARGRSGRRPADVIFRQQQVRFVDRQAAGSGAETVVLGPARRVDPGRLRDPQEQSAGARPRESATAGAGRPALVARRRGDAWAWRWRRAGGWTPTPACCAPAMTTLSRRRRVAPFRAPARCRPMWRGNWRMPG